LRLRETYDVLVLGLNRHGAAPIGKLSSLVLHAGDVVLLQGSETSIRAVAESGIVNVIGPIERSEQINARRLPAVLTIFAAALLLPTFKILDTSTSIVLGAVVMLVLKIITPGESYRRLEWNALILVGGLLAIGTALTSTGLAAAMAESLAGWGHGMPPAVVLAMFFAVTVLLSQPLSNQGAAVIMIPLAVKTSTLLGFNPRPFGLAVTLAASCSFLPPPPRTELSVGVRSGTLPLS
jgi:di/tricarboxylate transporter